MTTFACIGLVGKHGADSVGPTLRQLAEQLRGHGCEVLIEQASHGLLGNTDIEAVPREELGLRCDLVVVVGGDGTLLDTGRSLAPHGVPILGINQGRLGFMVDVLPKDMEETVKDVLAGRYIREERLMLSVLIERGSERLGPFNALNDVVVHNKEFARLLEFDTLLDDSFISHHRADGMIVATPTGSTAYALSGGGPVLHPAMEAIVLVPICPHTLSDRPMVVDSSGEVGVEIDDGCRTHALVTCDGQINWTLHAGDRLRISRAENCLSLIHPPGYDYFRILRTKLQWGRGEKPNNNGPHDDTRGC